MIESIFSELENLNEIILSCSDIDWRTDFAKTIWFIWKRLQSQYFINKWSDKKIRAEMQTRKEKIEQFCQFLSIKCISLEMQHVLGNSDSSFTYSCWIPREGRRKIHTKTWHKMIEISHDQPKKNNFLSRSNKNERNETNFTDCKMNRIENNSQTKSESTCFQFRTKMHSFLNWRTEKYVCVCGFCYLN